MRFSPIAGRLRALAIAAALAAAASAAAAPAEAAAPAPGVTGAPSTAVVDHELPTTGCGLRPPATPGTRAAQTIDSGGRTRDYVLQIPAGYRPDRPDQLVLVFHGRGKSGISQADVTAVTDPHTIAVYPQGLPGTGKTHEAAWPGAPYSTPEMADDPLFVSDLITHLQQTLCVDPSRIMLAGKSNGGAFAARLACSMSRRIAAVTVVSGALYGQHGCSPARPVPVLDFHGTGDTVIPYAGDPSRDLPPVMDWAAQWARQDGCTTGPHTFFHKADVTGLRWSHCQDHAGVTHYRIAGGGHVWPGGSSAGATQTISATSLMLTFLRTHPLGERCHSDERAMS
ncbi:alpha/beta hydrolase family esterase [Streptomyces sp. NRRL F-5126]|uniref:alpha/beta hydrolase family esterase n=1 Tax=Streptomyces sp. NRRL F-5126 TaxID=1463857 RepID=UPI000690D46C|nr:PHB depolymerase family esterase [Streptomyces sp. NRRL F-5126]